MTQQDADRHMMCVALKHFNGQHVGRCSQIFFSYFTLFCISETKGINFVYNKKNYILVG